MLNLTDDDDRSVVERLADMMLFQDQKSIWCASWRKILLAESLDSLRRVVGEIEATRDVGGEVAVKKENADTEDTTKVPKMFIADSIMIQIPGTSGNPTQFRTVLNFLESAYCRLCCPGVSMVGDSQWGTLYNDGGVLFCSQVFIHNAWSYGSNPIL